tara:strand:- start:423 stop:836 length:414 start_codon:yes stop_codon:yes gene_type:complete
MNFFGGFFQKKTTKGGKPSTMKAGKRKNRKTAKKSRKSRKSRKMKGGNSPIDDAYPQPKEPVEEFTEHGDVDASKKPLKVVPVDGFRNEIDTTKGMKGGKKGGNVAVPVILAAANFMGPKKTKKGGKKRKTNKRRRH